MEFGQTYILLACLFGIAMTWSVGANDLANIMSTTLGSKAVTIKQAMLLAITFEFAGAFLGSSGVTHTVSSGLINSNLLVDTPDFLIFGMLSALIASTCWMLLASFFGLPVSITNAIVGSIVGFGALLFGLKAIFWQKVLFIVISWICSPLLAGILAFALFRSIQFFIFDGSDPLIHAKRYLPIYFFIVGIILGAMTFLKGLAHYHISIDAWGSFLILLISGLTVSIIGKFLISNIKVSNKNDRFYAIEKMFGLLMAFTACAMVFAHGSNDVAIAVGPMAAVVLEVGSQANMAHFLPLHHYLIAIGCVGVLLGFFMYGRKVIETVGGGITTLTPSRAFAATLAAATAVVISTSTGIPVSATQTLVGGVLGVGLARGIGALNLTVVRNIFMSWVFTIPAACVLTIGFFIVFKHLFH